MAEEIVFDYHPPRSRTEEKPIRPIRITWLYHDMGIGGTTPASLVPSKGAKLSNKERRLVTVLSWLNRFCREYGVPEVVCEDAGRIARKLVATRKLERIMCALRYYIALHTANPRVWRDFISNCNIHETIAFASEHIRIVNDARKTAMAWTAFIASELGFSEDMAALAQRIVLQWQSLAPGRTPRGLAAAAVYTASCVVGRMVNQDAVAKVAMTTTNTLRNTLKALNPVVTYILDNGETITIEYASYKQGIPTPHFVCGIKAKAVTRFPEPRDVIVKGRELVVRGLRCG